MGNLHPVKHPANQKIFLTPGELECLAELEAQRHKSLGGVLDAFRAPGANEVSNCAVAAPLSLRLDLHKQRLDAASRVLGPVRIRAQRLLQQRFERRELAFSLLVFVLRGYVAGGFEPLLDRVSGQSRSSANLSVRELVAQLHAPHLANHVHGDHLYIPAESFSKAVEHTCQPWIGALNFRLSVFSRRKHTKFAFSPWAVAMRAIEASGLAHSAGLGP